MLSALAALLTLTVASCARDRDAASYLRDEGFESVVVEREGAGTFRFTATRDGQTCEGTVELGGVPGVSREARHSHSCTDTRTAAVDKGATPTSDPEDGAAEIVALGRVVEPTTFRHLSFLFEVSWQDQIASQTAGALLTALMVNDREWIAAHATDELRKVLATQVLNLNSVLLMVGKFDVGHGKLISSTDGREVVEFPLRSERFAEGVDIHLTVTYENRRYADFKFGGDSWDRLIEGYLGKDRFWHCNGAWLMTKDTVVPNGIYEGSEDLRVRFVFDGYKELDGYALLDHDFAVERDGKEISSGDPGPEKIEGGAPEPAYWDVVLTDLKPGHYKVTFSGGDVRHSHLWVNWVHEFEVREPL